MDIFHPLRQFDNTYITICNFMKLDFSSNPIVKHLKNKFAESKYHVEHTDNNNDYTDYDYKLEYLKYSIIYDRLTLYIEKLEACLRTLQNIRDKSFLSDDGWSHLCMSDRDSIDNIIREIFEKSEHQKVDIELIDKIIDAKGNELSKIEEEFFANQNP